MKKGIAVVDLNCFREVSKLFERSHRTLLLVLLVFCIASCAAPIRNITNEDLINNADTFSLAYKNELDLMQLKSRRRIAQEYQNELKTGEKQSYDILVLSSGGALGAFGAGFLSGWGDVKDGEFKRPDFDSVSGISTGALIAPFAFVGTDEAYSTIVDLYKNPVEDMIVARAILSFLAGGGAFYDASKLHNQIRKGISKQLVQEIGKQSTSNKLLLIGATNLDYGVMRVWDASNIAASEPVDSARELITDRLIASAAIPGAFPPVNIDNNLYVDGGASMQVVSGIDNREWLYLNTETSTLNFVEEQNPIQIRIWIIVNNKLVMEPEVTTPTWGSIAAKSLISLMRGSTLQTIQDTETFAQMINLRKEFNVKMHYVAIPQDYEIIKSSNMFDKDKMRALVELGRSMGANKNSWKQRAIRPGASFLDIKNHAIVKDE